MSFNPEMLQIGRKAERLTQVELADKSGIKQSRLSKIENGLLEPSEPDLIVFAGVLDRPVSFFSQAGTQVATQASWYHHRKRRTAPAKAVACIHAKLDILRLEIARLVEGIQLPVCKFDPIDPDEHGNDIERIADMVRSWWGVPAGPIENMTRLIERNGGIVVSLDFGTQKVDALSLVRPELPPLFFINSRMPSDRIRHSLAHELGHVFLHTHPTGEKQMENEADLFAGEFLMPRREIKSEFWPPVRLMDLAAMKPRWKVSIQSLAYRAKEIGVIDERRRTSLFVELTRLGWRTTEPKPLPEEPPRLMREVIERHERDLGHTISDLADMIRSTPERIKTQFLGGGPHLYMVRSK